VFTVSDWLKKRSPPAGPPRPGHVDHAMLMAQLHEKETLGIATPATTFLRAQAPAEQRDKWGQPLPLSEFDQERLDQMVAIMASPYERGRALVHAGMITPGEVDAIMRVYPEIYSVLTEEAIDDMVDHPPPYQAWAEATLGTLFGVPAEQVYSGGTPKMPERQESLQGKPGKGSGVEVPETPTDRREVAVREMRS
jgi:hypothetical protein